MGLAESMQDTEKTAEQIPERGERKVWKAPKVILASMARDAQLSPGIHADGDTVHS
jgi:hypothetical protein